VICLAKWDTAESGAIIVKMTIGEILKKLDALEHPNIVTGSLIHEISRKDAISDIKLILEKIEVVIPNQKIKEKLMNNEETYKNWVHDLIQGYIEGFFERSPVKIDNGKEES
jgi:predicted GTPase